MSETTKPVKVSTYPKTVEVWDPKHNLYWYFKLEKETLLASKQAITFAHVEIDEADFKPIKRYPFTDLPERIETPLNEEGYKVIG